MGALYPSGVTRLAENEVIAMLRSYAGFMSEVSCAAWDE